MGMTPLRIQRLATGSLPPCHRSQFACCHTAKTTPVVSRLVCPQRPFLLSWRRLHAFPVEPATGLPDGLRRDLVRQGLAQQDVIHVGRLAASPGVVRQIHLRWRNTEVRAMSPEDGPLVDTIYIGSECSNFLNRSSAYDARGNPPQT